jgi:hypothetical protein
VRASLKVTEARIAKARAALDRYFQAFETGELESAACSERVQALTTQLRELESERAGLQRQAERSEIGPADIIQPAAFAAQFAEIMKRGAPASQRKHLVKVLVPRVVVFSREEIDVYFRAPVPSVRVTGVMAPCAALPANALGKRVWDRFGCSY